MYRKTTAAIAVMGSLLFMQATANAVTNYFTEMFYGDYDLGGLQMIFEPIAVNGDFYEVTEVTPIDYLPINTSGGTSYNLTDDWPIGISLPTGRTFPFYGTSYSAFWLSPNGFITFEGGTWASGASIYTHFNYHPQISMYFADLDPSEGGTVRTMELEIGGIPRGFVVSFENVPRYSNPSVTCSFQCVMFYGGGHSHGMGA